MPNFSNRRRSPVRLRQLHPYMKKPKRASGLSDDGIERALDAMADRARRAKR